MCGQRRTVISRHGFVSYYSVMVPCFPGAHQKPLHRLSNQRAPNCTKKNKREKKFVGAKISQPAPPLSASVSEHLPHYIAPFEQKTHPGTIPRVTSTLAISSIKNPVSSSSVRPFASAFGSYSILPSQAFQLST